MDYAFSLTQIRVSRKILSNSQGFQVIAACLCSYHALNFVQCPCSLDQAPSFKQLGTKCHGRDFVFWLFSVDM